jgi:hypothetical protein
MEFLNLTWLFIYTYFFVAIMLPFSGPESDAGSGSFPTDDYKIGDRVWVSGTKPGVIAFIGETQFAPGDWAGVVLDEPVGKNDGSVMGVRYFQVYMCTFFLKFLVFFCFLLFFLWSLLLERCTMYCSMS